ncbi:MAG: NAD-dependent epimerase [Saprospiraceae bacterium]
MHILITGTAGFIGYHLTNALLNRGDTVIGLDSINNYYDVSLKIARLEDAGIPRSRIAYKELVQSTTHPGYRFIQLDLEDEAGLATLFREHAFDAVINLAAQAGVRYSLKNPAAYISSNVVGFANLLENCRQHGIGHLVYASSSSVYGMNQQVPFSTHHNVDHPVSLYAATKKSNELMAHTYSHLFQLPTTGLRFFTVYGPWGRPDMAYFSFTKAILEGKTIDVYNHGDMSRDFTYIDDIVDGIIRTLDRPPVADPAYDKVTADPATSWAPYRVYNIGNHQPDNLLNFIGHIEEALGKTAEKNLLPMQPGDVPATFADISDLQRDTGFQPRTGLKEGIRQFVDWYRTYYQV